MSPFVHVAFTGAAPPPASGFPVIESYAITANNSNSLTHAFTLPSGIAEDDLLLLEFRLVANPMNLTAGPSGWTLLHKPSTTNSPSGAYYKVAAGGESGTISVTGDYSCRSVAIIRRISGAAVAESTFVAYAYATATKDGPSLTPSWGTASNLWITSYTARTSDWTMTTPTDYGSQRAAINTSSTDPGQGAGLVSAHRELEASSENPSAWVLASGGGSILTERMHTIAVRPA